MIGIVFFYFINSSSKTISDNEFSSGVNLQLKEDKKIKFMSDNQKHIIKVNSVGSDSVNLIIQSDPIQVNIKIGETKKFDLDSDGFYDVQIKLNGIKEGIPDIYIIKIHESISTNDDTPLKYKSKSITVTGKNEEYAPECVNNDDCTQTCTNCDGGTHICAYSSNPSINQRCVECISDFSCMVGYECVNNVCVVEEQNEEPEAYHRETITDPNTILDCYSADISEILCSPEDTLEFTDLFETRLKSCEISQGTFALGFEPLLGIFRGYEIQNEQGGNCIVKFWFLENNVIPSNLLNKEMICEYDSSKRTAQDVNDCFEECCSGELVDAINEMR